MEQLIPFGMFSQAVDQLGGKKLLGLPAAGAAPADARANRFFAVLHWLESHSEALTLVGLDDLHWADPDSLELLSFVARPRQRGARAEKTLAPVQLVPPAAGTR